MSRVLIVGGVAGGASAAARLRRLDEAAEIVMFERGEHISFANCGLPYYIGGDITSKEALVLQTPESFHARFRVDVRVRHEVMAIDRQAKMVTVKNHTTGNLYADRYDVLILSPGAAPILPSIPGIHSERVFTLRTIPDTFRMKDFIMTKDPENALIVGGGAIGVELAENLKGAGVSVTLVELADQVIAPLDYDMACDVHLHMKQKGVKLILGNAVQKIEEDDDGLTVELNQGTLRADMLIMAVGVRPESGLAKAAGLRVNERGCIVVDETMKTSDAFIYAAGDAVEVCDYVTRQKGFVPLAGPANKQGRIIADNICGLGSTYKGTQGSAILRAFDMTVAATGVNEKTAKKLGLNYDKAFTYSASHAAYYPGAFNMSLKTLFDRKTGRILGAQITGFEGVDKRCDVMAAAIRAGMTARDLTELELCYAPPYSSAKDPVNMAGYVMENLIMGKARQFHWHDVQGLPRDGSVHLLDIRSMFEYEAGHIEGFVNSPLDELRDHVAELDKKKKVYVCCQIGLRGYIACRILEQNGFDAYNLSGGYRLYSSILGRGIPQAVDYYTLIEKQAEPSDMDAAVIKNMSSEDKKHTV